eukprot:g330.t1
MGQEEHREGEKHKQEAEKQKKYEEEQMNEMMKHQQMMFNQMMASMPPSMGNWMGDWGGYEGDWSGDWDYSEGPGSMGSPCGGSMGAPCGGSMGSAPCGGPGAPPGPSASAPSRPPGVRPQVVPPRLSPTAPGASGPSGPAGSIVSASLTPSEQRALLHMRRTEELAKVEENRPPSPIVNGELFEIDGTLRNGLQETRHKDYQILEQAMWEFFLQVYGGGPAILRYNPSGVLPALTDPSVTFEGKWREGRPDSGCGRIFDPYSGRGFDGEIQEGFLWTCAGKGLLKNGSHYEGQVVNGSQEGSGREVRPDGSILEGTFEHGLLHGFGRTVDAHGMAQEGEWFHGESCMMMARALRLVLMNFFLGDGQVAKEVEVSALGAVQPHLSVQSVMRSEGHASLVDIEKHEARQDPETTAVTTAAATTAAATTAAATPAATTVTTVAETTKTTTEEPPKSSALQQTPRISAMLLLLAWGSVSTLGGAAWLSQRALRLTDPYHTFHAAKEAGRAAEEALKPSMRSGAVSPHRSEEWPWLRATAALASREVCEGTALCGPVLGLVKEMSCRGTQGEASTAQW